MSATIKTATQVQRDYVGATVPGLAKKPKLDATATAEFTAKGTLQLYIAS